MIGDSKLVNVVVPIDLDTVIGLNKVPGCIEGIGVCVRRQVFLNLEQPIGLRLEPAGRRDLREVVMLDSLSDYI